MSNTTLTFMICSSLIAHVLCMEKSLEDRLRQQQLDGHFLKSIKYEDIATLENLLNKGAHINCRDYEGTALHKLCQFFYLKNNDPSAQYFIIEKMKFLLNQGADVNAQEHLVFETPLHAVPINKNNMMTLLELLLQYGANPFKLNRFNETLFHKMVTNSGWRRFNDYENVITTINKTAIAHFFQFKNQKTVIEKIASERRIKWLLLIFNRLGKIPKDIIFHICSFMPEELYTQKMVDNILKNVSNQNQIGNIVEKVPLMWIKNSIGVFAKEHNTQKVDNIIGVIVQDHIKTLKKLLSVRDHMDKMVYQYFKKELHCDAEQLIEFLNPENVEKNFAVDIRNILYKHLGIAQ